MILVVIRICGFAAEKAGLPRPSAQFDFPPNGGGRSHPCLFKHQLTEHRIAAQRAKRFAVDAGLARARHRPEEFLRHRVALVERHVDTIWSPANSVS